MVHVRRSCERATFVETQTRGVVRIILSLFKHVRIVCRARGSLVRFVFNALLNGVTIAEGNNREKIHVLHARGRGIGVRIEKNKTTGEHAFPHKCIRTWHASTRDGARYIGMRHAHGHFSFIWPAVVTWKRNENSRNHAASDS